jgi:hypothetical protein
MDKSLVGMELAVIFNIANNVAHEKANALNVSRDRIDLLLDRHAAFFPALMYLCPHKAVSSQR